MAATGLVGANPYQRGFNFDISSKPTGLLIDLQAKERARNDALDRYFMDYDKNINPAGMRGVDIDDLTRLNQASKEFYFKNKKNIQNPMLDGGRAYSQFSNYNKQQLALVASSKEEAAKGKVAQQAIMQANKEGRIVSPETFESITRSQKRILDPEYKSWDASSFDAYKPFNPTIWFKDVYGENGERFNSDQTPTIKRQGNFVTITTPSSFDAKNLPVIESIATSKLNEKGYASHIKELANNPQYLQDFKKTNDVFKKFYGRDIDPNSQKDLSVAFTLSFAPTDVKIKTVKQDIGNSGGGSAVQNTNAATDIILSGVKTGKYYDVGGKPSRFEKLALPDDVLAEFTSNKTIPQIAQSPNGKFYAIYGFVEDAEGNKTNEPDMAKIEEIPEINIRSAIINKVLSSNYKTKALLSNTGTIPPTQTPTQPKETLADRMRKGKK